MAVVWYIGESAVRSISAASWDSVGAPGDERTWSAANGWSIPDTAFTPAQLAYLAADTDFDTNGSSGSRPGPGSPYWVRPDGSPASKGYVQEQDAINLQTAKAYADSVVSSGLPSVIDLGGPNDTTGA